MPFAPRSQHEQKQQTAAPPPMPVVENFQKQPATDLPITHDNTEEQIAELNELLIHVLDELADMKWVLQTNAPKRQKQRPPSKRHPPSDEESSEEEEEESDEAPDPPPRAKPSKASIPAARQRGFDFSNCF